jgi:hypothetical protein
MYSTASFERHKDTHCEHIMPRPNSHITFSFDLNEFSKILSNLSKYSHRIKVVSIHPVAKSFGKKKLPLSLKTI